MWKIISSDPFNDKIEVMIVKSMNYNTITE